MEFLSTIIRELRGIDQMGLIGLVIMGLFLLLFKSDTNSRREMTVAVRQLADELRKVAVQSAKSEQKIEHLDNRVDNIDERVREFEIEWKRK